ncbi:hypothetical protein SBRY_30639 [Actinacidiphila bryophytorum]|uniref:Uncharacterized protein n=1 Tax=Actinacidiphila bryophytorum TaxID=1436133 RepID=A0A9W4H1J2_9ACTN|nr:hypothetical protein SBRY_30639 [Actinacidiphila bryophytorum]
MTMRNRSAAGRLSGHILTEVIAAECMSALAATDAPANADALTREADPPAEIPQQLWLSPPARAAAGIRTVPKGA